MHRDAKEGPQVHSPLLSGGFSANPASLTLAGIAHVFALLPCLALRGHDSSQHSPGRGGQREEESGLQRCQLSYCKTIPELNEKPHLAVYSEKSQFSPLPEDNPGLEGWGGVRNSKCLML